MSFRRIRLTCVPVLLACIGLWASAKPATVSAQLSTISVSGNRLVDSSGQEVIFRGVNALDPLAMHRYMGHFDNAYFAEARAWGATVIRLPIHPSEWHNTFYADPSRPGRDKMQVIENAVTMAANNGMYSIIDWHVIGYPPSNYWFASSYRTDQAEMVDFWTRISQKYRNDPRVIAYEPFNEPVKCRSCWQVTEEDWIPMRDWYEGIIDVIRTYDTTKPIIVTGLDWGYQLWPMINYPIRRPNLIFSAHPYPSKGLPWESNFGFMKDTAPVLVTELAFENEADGGTFPESSYNNAGGTGLYREEIVKYLESRGIGWIPWSFGPQWSPEMTYDWSFTPTEQGGYWKQQLQFYAGGGPPPPPCTATAAHVDAMTVTAAGSGKNKRGQATVTVKDNCGNPVANANVTGNFSGTFNESGRTSVTNANGVATITTNGTAGGSLSVTFCVTAITHTSLTYNSAANVETCDSN